MQSPTATNRPNAPACSLPAILVTDVPVSEWDAFGCAREIHGTNPDTTGHVVASLNNARIFHGWAVSS